MVNCLVKSPKNKPIEYGLIRITTPQMSRPQTKTFNGCVACADTDAWLRIAKAQSIAQKNSTTITHCLTLILILLSVFCSQG